MNLGKIWVPLAALVFLAVAYRSYSWSGVVIALGAIVMYLLLHFTRTMQVLKRAADRPIGYVGSAVMLNAKLKPKVTLAACDCHDPRPGPALRTREEEQPEVFRWTDGGGLLGRRDIRERQIEPNGIWCGPMRPTTTTSAPQADAPSLPTAVSAGQRGRAAPSGLGPALSTCRRRSRHAVPSASDVDLPSAV